MSDHGDASAERATARPSRLPLPRTSPPDERARRSTASRRVELVDALRSHHLGTAEHSNRLAADCRRVGAELGLPPDALFELELVAILHDIGKLAVPARILDLPRPLNPRERLVVREHTVRGAEILAEVAGLEQLAPLVRASHERWDGTGYPDRPGGRARSRSRRGSCSPSTRSTR